MKVTIESTTKVVHLDGVAARIWEGTTESGVAVMCFVTRITAPEDADVAQFQAELSECKAPSVEARAIPLRMIL